MPVMARSPETSGRRSNPIKAAVINEITSSSRVRGIPRKDGGLMGLPYSASLLAAVGLICVPTEALA